MKSTFVKPKFRDNTNSRVGLVALSTDFSIEKDFNSIFLNLPIDLFVNRLPFYNPLTDKNLIKMTEKLTEVTENILPNQTLDTVAYGCTSGTIAAGIDKIINKIQLAKPNCKVTTPITSAVNALKHLNLKKISVFTPYPQAINEKIINYFKLTPKKKVDISSWKKIVANFLNCKIRKKIAIVGKYFPLEDAYYSIYESIKHASIYHKVCIDIIKINAILAIVYDEVIYHIAIIIGTTTISRTIIDPIGCMVHNGIF